LFLSIRFLLAGKVLWAHDCGLAEKGLDGIARFARLAGADGAANFLPHWDVSLPMKPLARQPAEILVIDFDPLTLMGTAAVLDMAGYVCHCARDRQAAIKAAQTIGLDLVICDVNLGGQSGLDLCRELRRLPGMQDVPVMFVSTSQLPDIVRRSHEAGGAYYLRKPFDPSVLIELVGKALWLPHVVQSRLAMHQPAPQTLQPQKRLHSKLAALSGIRLPLA
jgi:CheY-like chemotaxis protein